MSLLLLFKPTGAPPAAGGSVGAPASLPHLAGVLFKSYSLTAEQGTYSITGQDATLKTDLILTAEQGTYSLAGQDVGLLGQNTLGAEQGTYSVSGQDAGLYYGYLLSSDTGYYNLNGIDQTLTYSGEAAVDSPAPFPHLGMLGGLGYEPLLPLSAEQGTYTLSGQDAGFLRTYILTADTGVYSQNGQIVNLQAGQAQGGDPAPLPSLGLLLGFTGGRTLTCDPGIYSIIGSDGLVDFEFAAEQGTYDVTGQDAGLNVGYLLTAEQGTYDITGQDAGGYVTSTDYILPCDPGTYDITGQDAGLYRGYPMSAEQGFYGLLGQDATFSFGIVNDYVMPADSGTYSLTGQDATLTRSEKILQCETGYYTISQVDTVSVPSNAAGRSSKRRRRERYIAKYKGQEYEFDSLEKLEEFVEKAKKEQKDIPKRNRAQVKISLAPEYVEKVEKVVSVPSRLPAMPQSAALAFIRKIEAEMAKPKIDEEEDELIAWLI